LTCAQRNGLKLRCATAADRPPPALAPITAMPCYYYRTLVWEWKQHGKNKDWVKVADECLHLPFFLDDNTGRVPIDPRGADLDIHRDFQQEFCDSFFTTKDPAPANVRSFLARHGVVTDNKIKVEDVFNVGEFLSTHIPPFYEFEKSDDFLVKTFLKFLSWIPNNNAEILDVFGYHCSRPNNCSIANNDIG